MHFNSDAVRHQGNGLLLFFDGIALQCEQEKVLEVEPRK